MESKPSGKELFKIYEKSIFGDKAYAIFEVDFDNARLYSTIDAIIENHWKGFRNRDYETKLELCLQTLTNSAYMYYIYTILATYVLSILLKAILSFMTT